MPPGPEVQQEDLGLWAQIHPGKQTSTEFSACCVAETVLEFGAKIIQWVDFKGLIIKEECVSFELFPCWELLHCFGINAVLSTSDVKVGSFMEWLYPFTHATLAVKYEPLGFTLRVSRGFCLIRKDLKICECMRSSCNSRANKPTIGLNNGHRT